MGIVKSIFLCHFVNINYSRPVFSFRINTKQKKSITFIKLSNLIFYNPWYSFREFLFQENSMSNDAAIHWTVFFFYHITTMNIKIKIFLSILDQAQDLKNYK